ncbi:hypothetical protein Fot_28488 [Forsythia ovata]|uniref:Uncharacterized protein n=1 Tax=Forsythia ovata TaxID=205694 RepID=A0ABD1TP77_9LAMI
MARGVVSNTDGYLSQDLDKYLAWLEQMALENQPALKVLVGKLKPNLGRFNECPSLECLRSSLHDVDEMEISRGFAFTSILQSWKAEVVDVVNPSTLPNLRGWRFAMNHTTISIEYQGTTTIYSENTD